MTLTVAVPSERARELVGELPCDVEVVVWNGCDPRPACAERIALFTGPYDRRPPTKATLASLPALRTIQVLTVGVDRWLTIVPAGVDLCNARGAHGVATTELAIGGLIAVLRDLPGFVGAQQRHEWHRPTTATVQGRRVLVVGAGDVGARVAAALEVLGASTTLVARRSRAGVRGVDELPVLLPRHDVVVLAVPYTGQTHQLVDRRFLAALPDGAVVVNVARGAIVDTGALLAELTTGRLYAFLDVTDPEPLPAGHPLWDAPNVLITPHVGSTTEGWLARAVALVHDQVMRMRAGQPPINRVKGDY